jgi:hypothetical protein
MDKHELQKVLMPPDTYDEFQPYDYPHDLQGWGGTHDIFAKLIGLVRPEIIVELGSWKGRSAINMANELSFVQKLYDSKIVCVDTWLGATEFIGKPDDDPKRGLRRVNGYPTVFYQFLSNVFRHGHLNRIVPFPQTTTNALRWMERNGVTADLVYVDASHDVEDVESDLALSTRVVRPISEGGILFGDDYCEHWPGVKEAVDNYVFYSRELGQVERVITFRYENGPGEPPSDYWVIYDPTFYDLDSWKRLR